MPSKKRQAKTVPHSMTFESAKLVKAERKPKFIWVIVFVNPGVELARKTWRDGNKTQSDSSVVCRSAS